MYGQRHELNNKSEAADKAQRRGRMRLHTSAFLCAISAIISFTAVDAGERLRAAAGTLAQRAVSAWRWGGDEYFGVLSGKDVEEKLCDATVNSQSGYFKVSGSKNLNYFYYLFESRRSPSTDPLIVWLTGGPGCSSLLALFTENGPCSISRDGFTHNNPYSWTTHANVMWIDQPAGVGFSYGDKADFSHNEEEVSEHLYRFLQTFFEANPRFQANPFYVFGESYGGHFAPATASRIFKGNKAKEGSIINLQGVGMGNPLVDPETQYGYYATMAFNNTYGVQVVDQAAYRQMAQATAQCQNLIRECQKNDNVCPVARSFCTRSLLTHFPVPELNPYDIREPCATPPLCYDFSPIESFLDTPAVRQALNVVPESGKWDACDTAVNNDFKYDFMKGFHQVLPPMLEAGIKVLVYAGDADFICNWMGNKAWTLKLDWAGKEGFNNAPDKQWQLDNQKVAEYRSYKGLTYMTILNAGHMVPLDQPHVALSMLDDFLFHGAITSPAEPSV